MPAPTGMCEAVYWRARLTDAIELACVATDPDTPPASDGSEAALALAFDRLTGIVNEYRAGGDQMTEGCTCGKHEATP